MNLKREVIVAALLAIMLGIGLGFASYSFVAEIPQKPVIRALALYTQQAGLGANQSGGTFGPGTLVQLFAYLTAEGFPINQNEVTFNASDPNGNETTQSALTDDSGIAKINLTLPAKDSALGNWTVTAAAQVENETLSDSMTFECRIASTPIVTVKTLDLYTQRGGLGINESGGTFEQEETVQLFAYLTSGGSPINLTEVVFRVKNPSGDETTESALTDLSGKANINLTLPSDVSALGNWIVTAAAHVENETVSDLMVFECQAKEVNPPVRRILDLYTQRGGLGVNMTGGVFGPSEIVQLFAYLTSDGLPINQTEVAFTICAYGGNPTTEFALTDDVGIARVNFTIPSGTASQGNWSVSAVAHVENETVSDFLFFGCGTLTTTIQVLTRRYGDLSVDFKPLDYVTVEVHVDCEYDLLPAQLELDVMYPNGSYLLTQSITTDAQGDAITEFQIPWPDNVFGTWQIHASFEAQGRQVEAYAYFECQPSQMMLDVYTQRGGQGQNVHSEPFLLGENVTLTAVFVDALNLSLVVDKLVSFEIKLNGTTFAVLTAQTDSTGVASVTFQIPPDASFVGQWEVYARADVYGLVLLDTLVFAVEQPQG
jgi:hypothetical protein